VFIPPISCSSGYGVTCTCRLYPSLTWAVSPENEYPPTDLPTDKQFKEDLKIAWKNVYGVDDE
jgi:hypothetical protein